MRGLSLADSGCPTPTCQLKPSPPVAWQPLNCPLLREWPSDLITSNYCPYCCLGLRSNHSAAVRSPRQVDLSWLDTVSDARQWAAHRGSQRQRSQPWGLQWLQAPHGAELSWLWLWFKAGSEDMV